LIKISDVANPDVFSITEEPFTLCTLDLISPNGFETFRAGTPVELTWTSELVGDLSIFSQVEENGDWTLIEEGVNADDNSYMWTPEIATTWCKIKIAETAFPEIFDESFYRFFVIQLDLTAPAGGENIAGNSEFTITWEREIVANVRIEFSSDNGASWTTIIASASASDLSYTWTVPNIDADNCFIKLSSSNQNELFSVNSTAFSVYKVVGVEEHINEHENQLNIYPNPVENLLSFTLKNMNLNDSFALIEIYNSKGQIVLRAKEKMLKNKKMEINIQDLPLGLYFIKVIIDENSYNKSFVKI